MEIADSEDAAIGTAYRQLMGSRTGIVNSLNMELGYRESTDISTTFSIASDVEAIVENRVGQKVESGGKGETIERAFLSSFGEAVERYGLRFPDGDRLIRATYDEIRADEDKQTVDFEYLDIWGRGKEFALFDWSYAEVHRDTEIYWIDGLNLLTGERVYVPAELVWFSSGSLYEDKLHFGVTTNGVAAGETLADAILNGIYETVERDGMMKTWTRQETPPGVSLENLPEAEAFIDEYVEQDHFDIRLFSYHEQVPVDLPAIGVAAVHEGDRFPKFILGGDVSVDLSEAVQGAAIETAQGWPYMFNILDEIGIEDLRPAQNDNFKGNVLYYTLPENFDEVSFMVEGEKRVFDDYHIGVDWDTQKRIDYALHKLDEADCTPIAFDLTTPGMREADIHVARVWTPELIPITPSSTLPVEHPSLKGEDGLTYKPHPSP